MSTYNGRTGPNFSQFLNSLNAVPSSYEQEILSADDLNLDQELAMFTNTDFTDFDALGAMSTNQPMNFNINNEQHANVDNGSDVKYEELLSTDPAPFLSTYGAPLQPAPPHSSYQQSTTAASAALSASPEASSSANIGEKRKADVAVVQSPMEEQTRMAAEEDKRRRNTAASARFRVKKKQREQALEKTVKEAQDKSAQLQLKLEQLEMENKWLKNLITEKSGNQSEKEISDMYQKFRRESEECELVTQAKDGVGTK